MLRPTAFWTMLAIASHGASAGPFAAYVATLTEDSIYRFVDRNADGDVTDNGAEGPETSVFFGPGNASGFPGVGSAQAIYALGYDDLLAADGEESGGYVTRVYRLRDLNSDGDAMDAGEATIFWNSVLPLPGSPNFDRPKAIWRGDDGALYLADNNTINFDADTPEAIWRLEDLNGDGDVSDAGEVTEWLELSPIGVGFGFICEDFKPTPNGRIFFCNQTSSTNRTNLWIIEPDLSLSAFASNDDLLGQSFKPTGLALEPGSGRPVLVGIDLLNNARLLALTDSNGNGFIDDNGEAPSIYRSDISATGLRFDYNNSLDLDFAPDGSLWLLDLASDQILRFEHLDFDGTYNGVGESRVIYSSAQAGAAGLPTMDFPRTIAFAEAPECVADFNGDGELNFFDVQAFLAAFAAGDLDADLTSEGILDFFDVQAFLAAFSAGC